MSWFNKFKKTPIKVDVSISYETSEDQISLIRKIESGEITFEKKKPGYIELIQKEMWCDEYWESNCGRIRLWFEYSGFGSFTYLTFNGGKDVSDKLEYATELCLTIQRPNGGYLDKRLGK